MHQVDIYEAKANLSEIIASGEEVVITQHGEPVARLIPIRPPATNRIPGSARGRFTVPAEFFEPMPIEFLNAFEIE